MKYLTMCISARVSDDVSHATQSAKFQFAHLMDCDGRPKKRKKQTTKKDQFQRAQLPLELSNLPNENEKSKRPKRTSSNVLNSHDSSAGQVGSVFFLRLLFWF